MDLDSPSSHPRRILVLGGEASGKTTFARALAEALGIQLHELDLVAWQSATNPDRDLSGEFEPGYQPREPLAKRPIEARKRWVAEIAAQSSWVAEGVFLWWTRELFDTADVIVMLDSAHLLAITRRIVLRHLRSARREFGMRRGHEKFSRVGDYARAAQSFVRAIGRVCRYRWGSSVGPTDDFAALTARATREEARRSPGLFIRIRNDDEHEAALGWLTGR